MLIFESIIQSVQYVILMDVYDVDSLFHSWAGLPFCKT